MTHLHNLIAAWLYRHCDAVVFWGIVGMVGIALANGWIAMGGA